MSSQAAATIIGVAVLENPRLYDTKQPNSIAFNAQFFLAPHVSLVAHLRYYNAKGETFDSMGQYMVCSTLAKTQNGAKLGDKDIKPEDYHVVGDIIWLIPVSAAKEQLRNRPWVSISGAATIPSKDSSTFQKPIPKPNTYVTLGGFLSRYTKTNDIPDRFYVEVDHVVFLGRSLIPLETPGKSPFEGSCCKRKQGLRFSFDDDESPETPCRPVKKVKLSNGSPFDDMAPVPRPSNLGPQLSSASLSSD
ncbi:hypothetical protein B0H34DRAFT_264632 [Crassisporium funariophilum]|nr:hypothetical protein B0H34DRAFT_264632 [Crassisporium funariophilum]